MKIQLPDGTILEAPDGSDPEVVASGYLAAQKKPQEPRRSFVGPQLRDAHPFGMKDAAIGAADIAIGGARALVNKPAATDRKSVV